MSDQPISRSDDEKISTEQQFVPNMDMYGNVNPVNYGTSYNMYEQNQQPLVSDEAYSMKTKRERNFAWKNRQRMAWLSLISMIGVTVGLFFVDDTQKVEQIGIALSWFYVSMASIVGAFMGFKAWQSSRGRE